MKQLPTAPMLQVELSDYPRQVDGTEADVLNVLGQATREVLHRANVAEFDQLAWEVLSRAQLRLADHGLIVRQVDRPVSQPPTEPVSPQRRGELRRLAGLDTDQPLADRR